MTPILSRSLLRTQSDARLAQLAGEGSEPAYEAIVERYRKPLERRCRRMLGREDAEDAVQQAFVRAWSALRAEGEVRDLRAWLFRIARNTAIDVLRTSRFDYQELRESLRGAESPEAEAERAAVIRKTLAGVAGLPEAQREALMRIAIEGHSRAEVASQLGLSEGAVRQLVFRARSRLRAAASVVIPLPFVSWAAAAPGGAPLAERIAQIANTGAGLPVAAKAGAILASAAVVAAAPVAVERVTAPHAAAPQHTSAAQPADPGPPRGVLPEGITARIAIGAAPLSTRAEPQVRHASGNDGARGTSGAVGQSGSSSGHGPSGQAGRQQVGGQANGQGEHHEATAQSGVNEPDRPNAEGTSGQSDGLGSPTAPVSGGTQGATGKSGDTGGLGAAGPAANADGANGESTGP
jgi:RNA polymerase sigma factor (sigma-70 family)